MIRFQASLSAEQSAELWRALRPLFTTRACRTCDYGDSPECGHEQRAQRVCQAPIGDVDCAALPCLGACANPAARAAESETAA